MSGNDQPLTLRQLLHELTEDYLDLDQPVRCWALDGTDMVVTGVRSYTGRGGEHRQDLEMVRRDQEEHP